ncbi:MAG: amino acid ABC transporter substrate-binding protein, partial [Candidatus Electrothrix sp. AS4_5]|nr:amino acid ABC transporter substrate-binding protein [Candidatus Electrothrix gigas]
MKKIALIAILLCCAGILAARLLDYFVEKDKQTVYIALPGPMTGFSQEEGKAMLRGATLAYEQVKEDGKILKNKKIEIISYDDQNSQTAVRIASDIVAEDKVLLVLGHYTSTSCSAASPMYQGNGIPAITASAAVESATMESAWFFRTIPGTRAMTEFSIRSMQKLQKSTSKKIAMIYDANFYSTAAEEFKKKNKHLFDTVKIWPLKSAGDIQQIIAEIRAEQSIGPIFFFTGSQDCASLIVKFRSPGTHYPIIGLTSLAVPTFIRQFKNYSNEQKYSGYYTNGAYAVSPFISYLADQPNARSFRKKFIHKFNHEPLWVAATYYDAMLVALHAIE